jgi:hypothetical protein
VLLIVLGVAVGFVSKRWIEDPLRAGARTRELTRGLVTRAEHDPARASNV